MTRTATLFTLAALLSTAGWAGPHTKVAVDGPGLLRFVRDGRVVYSKQAVLTVIDGSVCDSAGPRIVPCVTVPPGSKSLTVTLEGRILADGHEVGGIVLALFKDEPKSASLVSSPERPSLVYPGQGEAGVVKAVGTETVAKPLATPTETTKPPKPARTQKAEGAAPGQRTQIILNEHAEVETDSYTLGDVAIINAPQVVLTKLASIVLGDTPPIGVERIVDQRKVLARAQAAGVNPTTIDLGGSQRSRVVRKGQQVSHDQFVDAAIRGAAVKSPGLTFEPATPGPVMTAPVGELELVCESLSGSGQDLSVIVGVYVDGKRFNGRSVKLRSTSPSSSLKPGAVVAVKVVSHGVAIQCQGKVVKVDASNGQVTVKIDATGAQLVGIALPDGTIEVKA